MQLNAIFWNLLESFRMDKLEAGRARYSHVTLIDPSNLGDTFRPTT